MRRDFQTSKAEEELGNLFLVARKKGITFTKREASRWVGGRYVLERLVAERKIRMTKPGDRQNSEWKCNAEDVLRHAFKY